MTSEDDSSGPAPRTVRDEQTLTGMRKTIANRLQESHREAVHVTVTREVDAETLVAAADAGPDAATVTDLVLCALSDTLDEHPAFNATFEDGTHTTYEEHNVGVAVDVDAGLVTPVVADVASKSVGEVAAERRRLTDAVQSGEYSMSDLRGGTVTFSNLGPLGVDSFTPVINPPEVAILGMGRITERAVRSDRGNESDGGVAFRKRIGFDLTFDHRVVDGADGARFLGTLAERVEAADEHVDGD